MTPNLPVVFAVLPGIVVGLLLPLAIVGLVAYGIFELVRAGSDRPADGTDARVEPATASAAASPAFAILEERFARGEIESEDYLRRRELLLATRETSQDRRPEEPAATNPTATNPTAMPPTVTNPTVPGPTTPATEATDVTAVASPAQDATAEHPITDDRPPAAG